MIQPLYASRSAHEVLDALLNAEVRSDHDIVQAYWTSQRGEDGFAAFWQRALHDGLVADTALPAKTVQLQSDVGSQPPTAVAGDGLEINFRPDPTIWDGRLPIMVGCKSCPNLSAS
ncbi:MAG: hypothetical protein R3E79_49600 [Caldilineaceae bacterium]